MLGGKSEFKDNENDDFDIVNGKIIYKNKLDSGKKPLDETKERGAVKNGSDGNLKKEEAPEKAPSNEKIVEGSNDETEEIQEEKVKIEVSKGRTRDIEGFYLTLKAAGRAKRTIEGYKMDIKQWNKLVALKERKTLYNLKLKDIEEFISKRDVNTAKRLLASLRQLSKWYLRDGFPALNIELQKVMSAKGKERIPLAKEESEFKKIRDEAKKMIAEGDRNGLWISLMLMCGLRISEIQTVEVSDKFIQVIGKGDKQRRIPAPTYIIEGLKNIPSKGRGGYQKSRFVVDKELRKLGYSHLHSLRHSYATFLINKGVRIEEIQKLLGHVSIATTQIYTKVKIMEGITDVLEE